MLGKVIASAPTRTEAALRLATALERLHLGGVVTNRDFLVNVLRSPAFLAGDTTTDFIDRVAPSSSLDLCHEGVTTGMIAAALWLRERNRSTDPHWGNLPAGFRNGRLPPTSLTFTATAPFFSPIDGPDDGGTKTVAYQAHRDGSVEIGAASGHLTRDDVLAIERDRTAEVIAWSTDSVVVQIGSVRQRHRITAHVVGGTERGAVDRLWVQMPTGTVELEIVPKFTVPGSDGPAGGFLAPMPGVVLDVRVAPGDTVAKGDTLIVLEAMKMEHHMTAPADGTVAEVRVAAGDQVTKDAVLLTMVGDADEPADVEDSDG